MSLVDIEYHPPCTYYADGDHRERSGYYLCACKASRAWHKTVPTEWDPDAATEAYLAVIGNVSGVYHLKTAEHIRRVAMQRAFLAGTGQPVPPIVARYVDEFGTVEEGRKL